MKRLLLLTLLFVCCTTLTFAQLGVGQQLPNNNFENWRTEKGSCVAPNGWNSIQTASGSYASMAAADFVSQASASPGGSGSKCAQVTCKNVEVKLGSIVISRVKANGSLSTG